MLWTPRQTGNLGHAPEDGTWSESWAVCWKLRHALKNGQYFESWAIFSTKKQILKAESCCERQCLESWTML